MVSVYQKWDHLKPNQHCTQSKCPTGGYCWKNAAGDYHRVDENGVQDGPAIIYPEGDQVWYLNGMCHRVDADGNQDGPAYITEDGTQVWWLNDKCHRLGGPAVICPDGMQEWFLYGYYMTQEQWAADPRVIAHHSQTQEDAESWLTKL